MDVIKRIIEERGGVFLEEITHKKRKYIKFICEENKLYLLNEYIKAKEKLKIYKCMLGIL